MKRGRKPMEKCDYNCFECKLNDCINNSRPTKKETEMNKAGLTALKKETMSHTKPAYYWTCTSHIDTVLLG